MNIPSSIKFRSVVLFALLVLGILSVTVLAVNADQSIVSYTMTYLPGTSDTVTNMPANETDLIPGSSSPYTVSSVVPLREGFEFVGWSLTWGISTDYTVKYLDKDTNEPVAPEKSESGLEVGTSVTENAIGVGGYTALDPTEQTITLAEDGNVIIFYYEKEPVLTDYVVKYLDKDTGEPVAPSKTETGLEVGTTVCETAISVDGYVFIGEEEEQTLVLAESGNEIIFYYKKLPTMTDYVVKYLDVITNESVADDKYIENKEVGTSVTENAITVGGYIALDPTEQTITLAEDGNIIIFYYEPEPILTDYVVRYLDTDDNPVAEEKYMSGLEVGTIVTESPIGVDGYEALSSTAFLVLDEDPNANIIIFYYFLPMDW